MTHAKSSYDNIAATLIDMDKVTPDTVFSDLPAVVRLQVKQRAREHFLKVAAERFDKYAMFDINDAATVREVVRTTWAVTLVNDLDCGLVSVVGGRPGANPRLLKVADVFPDGAADARSARARDRGNT